LLTRRVNQLKKGKRKLVWGLGIALFGVVLLVVAASPWRDAFIDSSLDQTQAKIVFEQVQRGELVADSTGRVPLPPTHSALTRDGRIYVTRKGDLLMVLFPTARGRGADVRGYLWCSRLLKAEDVEKDHWDNQQPAITINLPSFGEEPFSDQVLLETPLDTMPYYVSRLMD
jgi:hypothetical protein